MSIGTRPDSPDRATTPQPARARSLSSGGRTKPPPGPDRRRPSAPIVGASQCHRRLCASSPLDLQAHPSIRVSLHNAWLDRQTTSRKKRFLLRTPLATVFFHEEHRSTCPGMRPYRRRHYPKYGSTLTGAPDHKAPISFISRHRIHIRQESTGDDAICGSLVTQIQSAFTVRPDAI